MIMHKSPDVGVTHNDRLPLLASQDRTKSNEVPSLESPRITHTIVKSGAHELNEIWLVHSTWGAPDDVRDLLALINVQNRCRTASPIPGNPRLRAQIRISLGVHLLHPVQSN
jgi:hypothetical protein